MGNISFTVKMKEKELSQLKKYMIIDLEKMNELINKISEVSTYEDIKTELDCFVSKDCKDEEREYLKKIFFVAISAIRKTGNELLYDIAIKSLYDNIKIFEENNQQTFDEFKEQISLRGSSKLVVIIKILAYYYRMIHQ